MFAKTSFKTLKT